MPTYRYRCETCQKLFEKFHSMSDTLEQCILCESPHIKKVLDTNINITKSPKRGSPKPGKLVRQYIKDVKEELKSEKADLREKEYQR